VLEEQIERNVLRDDPVSDQILGTALRGAARVRGTAQISIEKNDRQVVLHALFTGSVRSRTTGYNGPVVLEFDSSTPFQASKQIVLGEHGMSMSPTTVTARMTTQTKGIHARRNGPLSGIVERAAWRRNGRLRSEADAIGSLHAAAQIRTAFDEEAREVAAVLQESLISRVPRFSWEGSPTAVRFRSAPPHIEIIVYRPLATADDRRLAPPPITGDPAIAVRAYRGVLLQAVVAANLKRMLEPLLTGRIGNSQSAAKPDGAVYDVNWSADGNWFAFDHTDFSPAPRTVVANP
jgi:hypothetical protein